MTPQSKQKSFVRNPAAADLVWDAMEALSEGIAVYDADNKLVTCNQRYVDMFPLISDLIDRGADWEDLLRAGAERGQYVDAIGRHEDWLKDRMTQGTPFNQTIEVELTSGIIYEAQFRRTRNNGFVVTITDMTERRKAEAVAREQKNILDTVLETSPMAVVMARLEDGRILYRSPEAITFLGDRQNALQHYESDKDRTDYIDALMQSKRVDDYRLNLRDAQGVLRASACWGRLVDFDGDTYVVTAIMDLSEQQEREALIRLVLEACPAPIQMTIAETGEVLFSSPETISLFGPADSAKVFYADAATRAAYLKQLQRDGSVTEFKAEYLDADNNRFWGAVSARLIRYNGKDVIVSHTHDLSNQMRTEAELAQQQDQLHQNEKMSAMGELLAGVAHELNNPLSIVVGHSLMLREDCTEPDVVRQVEKISHAAERCAKIVKTFLTMARQQPVKMHHVSINEIIQTAADVAGYGDPGEGVSIDCQLSADLPEIYADPDQITQVIINLLLNAEHALHSSGKGERIIVSTRATEDRKGVEILVEDDGPGIPENLRGRVFEPFFTTKDVGEGTGIGLALCHRIIQTHNGRISLTTGPMGGSVFKIFLPQAMATPDHPKEQAQQLSSNNPIRILILDDEEDVAELNAEILMRGGYQVDVFTQAEQAIESMRTQDYGLILSDLHMPETDGRGFYEIIKEEFPAMITKTGFVTGDTMGRSSQGFLKEAQRPCVEKPVSPKELRAFVNDILATAEQVQK